MLVLDERLSAIAGMVRPCSMVADIGTDHGYLGAYLLESNVCARVQFLDISAPSLAKAKRLIERRQLSNRALFNVGDGASALLEPAAQVIIAGMGADTVTRILEQGQAQLGDAALILQPNLGVESLRASLMRLRYRIVDECVVRAGGRHYVVLRAERGTACYSKRELLVGPVLLTKRDDALYGYAQFRLKVLRKALAGMKKGANVQQEAISEAIGIWEDIVSGR